MSFFHQPKPRHFHHEPIYYDEHKDRVRQIEERARKEVKAKDTSNFNPENIHGAFSRYADRRKSKRLSPIGNAIHASTGALIVIIIVLILIWMYLQK